MSTDMMPDGFGDYMIKHGVPKDAPPRKRLIDADSATRKGFPMARGLLDYFPDALAAVAEVSQAGNLKHNPGEDMHHARGKSMDHADCIMRHLVGRGGYDGDTRESAALAWRALALLQEELEAEFALPLPRGARAPVAAPGCTACGGARSLTVELVSGYETAPCHCVEVSP